MSSTQPANLRSFLAVAPRLCGRRHGSNVLKQLKSDEIGVLGNLHEFKALMPHLPSPPRITIESYRIIESIEHQ